MNANAHHDARPAKPRRLDQILARFGYCSRSQSPGWLRAGRVTVHGAPAASVDQKASPAAVLIDGQPIECPGGLLALFHKPAGCVCSRDSGEGRTIYEWLPARWSRRHPPVTSIGRLDRDTTGVLLVTDDGALVQRWTSPRHKVPKLYEVTVDAELGPGLAAVFASGRLVLEGEAKACLPATLEVTGLHQARLELVEGRYHQVKRMFASQGFQVTQLHRSRFGNYTLENLAPGEWRLLPMPAS